LGWVGLGWVGLGWVGLGWVGLGWVGSASRWAGLDKMDPWTTLNHWSLAIDQYTIRDV